MNDKIKDNFKSLEEIRKNIKSNFSSYKKIPDKDKVENLKDLFESYKNEIDVDSFLKPILHGSRDLIYSESNTTKEILAKYLEELRGSLEGLHKRPEENINEGIKEGNLANIFAWFDFHISQLREFENGLRDFKKLYE